MSTRRKAPASPRTAHESASDAVTSTGPGGEAAPDRSNALRAAAMVAIVALGLALRLVHIRLGLPEFIEEAIPFRRAFDMWGWNTGRVDLNPHLFHYPSLAFYLQFSIEQAHYALCHLIGLFQSPADYYLSFHIDPTPMVILGRLPGVAADVATILGVARIGERLRRGAGIAAAALVACSPTMILTSRAIFVDTVMTAFAVWGLERLIAYEREGGRIRLGAAALLIGLAAGAKYPAGALVVVLAWGAWRRRGRRGLPAAATGMLGAFAVFLATSPYILLDFATFRSDFAFLGALSGEGHLGNIGRLGFRFYADLVVRDLGWPCVLLAAGTVAFAIARTSTRSGWTTLWIALLVFGIPISVSHIQAQRYLLPAIPMVALLGSLAVFEITRLAPARGSGPATIVALAALVAPAALGGVRAGLSGGDDTQLEARRWCERNLAAEHLMLQESYGAPLLSETGSIAVQEIRAFGHARPELRQRFLARRLFRSVNLPLVVSGNATVGVQRGPEDWVEVRLFPHAVDLNRIFYDPRLLEGVDYVVTSSAVRERFADDTLRFAVQRRFYRVLDQVSTVVAEFQPSATVTGPHIRIHRIDPRAWSGLRASAGALDPLWWTRTVPDAYRRKASQVLAPGQPTSGGPLESDGSVALWVRSLGPFFRTRLAGFAHQMALQMTGLGRFDTGMAHALATLAAMPEDIPACLLYTACAIQLERWTEARAVCEQTIEAASATSRFSRDEVDFLRVTYAELLRQTGEPERARQVLEEVVRASAPGSENADRARRALATLGP